MENEWIGAWYIIKKLDPNFYEAIHYYYIESDYSYKLSNIEIIEIFNLKDNLINIKKRNLDSLWHKYFK